MRGLWFHTKQTFLLVFLRRLRTLPMLLILALLFVLMSLKAKWVLGAPYLFWHDDFLWVGALSLLAVGLFLEEWSFVAVLLDTDENNPINSSLPGRQGSRISMLAGVKSHLQIDTSDDHEVTDEEKQDIFRLVREIHSIATYSLAFLFGATAAFFYQWNNESLIGIPGSIIVAPVLVGFIMTGFVFVLFLVRRLILSCANALTAICRGLHRLIFKIPGLGPVVADWIFSEIINDKNLFNKFHLIAFFKNLAAIIVVGVISGLYWYGINGSADISVAFLVCTVFSMVLGGYGWMVFQRRRMRYEFVASLLVVAAIASYWGLGNVPKSVRMFHEDTQKDMPDDPDSALEQVAEYASKQISERAAWKQNIKERAPAHQASRATEESLLHRWRISASQSSFDRNGVVEENPRPIMVIVTNTGGGIKAQVWSSVVLCALENQFAIPRENKQIQFSRHVRLISGASGGMVGAGYWTATLDKSHHYKDPDKGNEVFFHKEEKSGWLSTESLIEKMSRDGLSKVARQGFYNDLLGLPLRLTGLDQSFERGVPTRGEALEDALIEFGPTFGIPFSDLRNGENEGWRPTLIYTPTSATDGRRFLICNQPLEYLFYSRFDRELVRQPPEPSVKRLDRNDIESNSIYSWRINYPSSDLKLATAARLSANFPIFVDSPYLPFGNSEHRIRIMDAGYTDNHGVYPVAVWINENREWIKKNTGGLLVVEISAGPLPRNPKRVSEKDADEKPKGSFAPEALGFVGTSFNKTLYHADRILNNAADYLNTPADPKFLRVETFAYNGEASLSWYLSRVEKLSLVYPFLSDGQVSQLLDNRNVKLSESIPKDLITIESDDIKDSVLTKGVDRFPNERFKESEKERAAIGAKLDKLQEWWHSRTQN